MKSKTAVLVEPGRFELEERDVPADDNQVLVKVVACGLCSWELTYFRGEIADYPLVPGHEGVGIVEEVGKNVRNFRTGDRVTGFWNEGFSEYAVADPEYLVKVPDNLELKHAFGEPLKCIVTIARAAYPEFGDCVLVVGCGFMGLLTIRALSGNIPAAIIAADLKEFNLNLAREMGATIAVNPKKTDLGKEIEKITEGKGVDISVEATGISAGLELASKYVKKRRPKILLVTAYVKPKTFNLFPWAETGAIVQNPHPASSLDELEDLRRAMAALEKGMFPMDKVITHEFKLDDIQKAFDTHNDKPEGYIKGIVIT